MSSDCGNVFFSKSLSETQAIAWIEQSGCLNSTWTYLRSLYRLSQITNGNADTQNLIANRGALIGTVWEDWSYLFVKENLLPPSIRLAELKSGMPGSADILFMVAGAAHPAAALLLIDFTLSLPIQQWKFSEMGSRSGRIDLAEDRGMSPEARAVMLPAGRRQLGWPSPALMTAFANAFIGQVVIHK